MPGHENDCFLLSLGELKTIERDAYRMALDAVNGDDEGLFDICSGVRLYADLVAQYVEAKVDALSGKTDGDNDA